MNTALVVIDMQMVMQDRIDAGRDHVPRGVPAAVARLVAACRTSGTPIVHVRHADDDPASALHPSAPGYSPMPCASEVTGEAVFIKRSSSAFATTGLADFLHGQGIAHIHVVGAVAGFCVNSTVRAGADLGFAASVVRDAVLGFDLPSAGLDARTIFDVTMGLLEADFARVVDSGVVVDALMGGG